MLIPSGPADARMMIVTECVTYRDLQFKTILNDREFDKMLSEAGIDRNRCFITSVVRGEIQGQNFDLQVAQTKKAVTPNHTLLHNRYVRKDLIPHVEALERDIELIKPKVILGIGNGALFALTGKWGIKAWRSSILDYETGSGHKCKVICTYTPALVQAVWKERNTVIFDLRKAWDLSLSDTPISAPEYNFIVEPDFGTTARTLDMLYKRALEGPTKLSVDIETRGGHIACTGIAWSKTDAICIPHLRAVFEPSEKMHYWREEEESFLIYRLYKLLTHPNVEVVGQNFIYDAQYFYRWFHFIPNFKRDTMIAQHSMFSSMPKGLDVLSALYTDYHVYWKEESKNWDARLGERQLWIYNCKDCVVTFEIDEKQQAVIDKWSVDDWPELRSVHDFQQSLFHPVLNTMIRGIRVNNQSKAVLSEELSAAIKAREDWITDILGHPLNIKSPKQMTDLFYRVFALKPILNRKSHSPTCDDQALEKISIREPLLIPLCDKIRELRSLGVFRSTFLEAPVDTDERMRCSFNIAGTETFRFSSSENAFGSGMNLQNIPIGDESEGLPNIRKLFLPDEGYEFFDIDLDSADLRIVTWESDCAGMKKYFKEGKKPYVEIAKNYYQDDSIDKHHPAYKLFKVICHATNYLGTSSGILTRLPKSAKTGNEIDGKAIDQIQKWYYEQFPEIADWQNKVKSQIASKRYVQNIFGYRIWCFDRLEGTVFNEVIAAIPQSTVAVLINKGYKNLHDTAPEIHTLLQVHDSLSGQYPIAAAAQHRQKVIDCCTIPLPYSEPLIIPVGIKSSSVSWGDCG